MVSYLGVGNNARSQTGTVSVTGMNFGQYNNTPSSRIDTLMCETTAWSAHSALRCVNVNNPTVHSSEVTVNLMVGTRYPQFTFDGAPATWPRFFVIFFLVARGGS